jgi:hypothetical protein
VRPPVGLKQGVEAGKDDSLCRRAMLQRYHYFLAIKVSIRRASLSVFFQPLVFVRVCGLWLSLTTNTSKLNQQRRYRVATNLNGRLFGAQPRIDDQNTLTTVAFRIVDMKGR